MHILCMSLFIIRDYPSSGQLFGSPLCKLLKHRCRQCDNEHYCSVTYWQPSDLWRTSTIADSRVCHFGFPGSRVSFCFFDCSGVSTSFQTGIRRNPRPHLPYTYVALWGRWAKRSVGFPAHIAILSIWHTQYAYAILHIYCGCAYCEPGPTIPASLGLSNARVP